MTKTYTVQMEQLPLKEMQRICYILTKYVFTYYSSFTTGTLILNKMKISNYI